MPSLGVTGTRKGKSTLDHPAVSPAVSGPVRTVAHAAGMPNTHRPHRRPRLSRSRCLSARLDREWALLRARPRVVARARSWRVTDRLFSDLDELLALAGHGTDRTAEANAVLGRLVDAGRVDQLAARVVLQRLLPGLLATVRRRGPNGELEELIGAAWLAIRSYRTDRRPQRIAANLVRDATYVAFTAPRRRLSASEVAIDPRLFEETPADESTNAFEELARLLADARGAGLPDADVELVRHLVRAGSPSLVAAECQVTTRTVRNRRDRATARLRQLTLAA
jgi:DNA-directed RNA polymerase specialized sigma24 family protein